MIEGTFKVQIQSCEKTESKGKTYWKTSGIIVETQENFPTVNIFDSKIEGFLNKDIRLTFKQDGNFWNAKIADESAPEAKEEQRTPAPEKKTEAVVLSPESIETNTGLSMLLMHKANVDIAISTAHAFPRSIDSFVKTAMSLATFDPEIAAQCNYALPRSGKLIEGPSVRLAEIICGAYKNIRAEGWVQEVTEDEVVCKGFCIDYEANNTQVAEIRVKIRDKKGIRYNQDMITMMSNAGVAKARRNAIFMVVPSVFTKKIWQAAKKVAAGDEKSLPQRRDAAIAYFKSLKITEAQILAVLGVQKVGDIMLEQFSTLSSMAQQYQNKESTLEELFSTGNEADLAESREEANAKLGTI